MKWSSPRSLPSASPARSPTPEAAEKGSRAAEEVNIALTETALFRNRSDAARQLAARLKNQQLHDPLVLAIPRGGVVTRAMLAREHGPGSGEAAPQAFPFSPAERGARIMAR